MTNNQMVVRALAGVALGTAALTTLIMVLATHYPMAPKLPLQVPPAAAVAEAPGAAFGAKVFERKGCVACHTVDGSARVGPSLLHDFGSTVELEDGTRVAMDEAYIRESVLSPRAKARPGYPPSMPSFDGQITDRELDAVVAYVRSLR